LTSGSLQGAYMSSILGLWSVLFPCARPCGMGSRCPTIWSRTALPAQLFCLQCRVAYGKKSEQALQGRASRIIPYSSFYSFGSLPSCHQSNLRLSRKDKSHGILQRLLPHPATACASLVLIETANIASGITSSVQSRVVSSAPR